MDERTHDILKLIAQARLKEQEAHELSDNLLTRLMIHIERVEDAKQTDKRPIYNDGVPDTDSMCDGGNGQDITG